MNCTGAGEARSFVLLAGSGPALFDASYAPDSALLRASYLLDELDFTEAALLAEDDATGLTLPFSEAIGEWEGLFTEERAARREVIRAEAVVSVRNERFDSLTRRFGAAVRAFALELLAKFFGGSGASLGSPLTECLPRWRPASFRRAARRSATA
ncbi:hypothetical protein QHF84_05320 [Polyangium sp. y55x31]|nr:hypothetical protein [Polyangium sp. y55x31]